MTRPFTFANDLAWLSREGRKPRRRSIKEFACQEIVIPNGPFSGRKFSLARQPYTAHWFNAIDSGHWSRFVATGPTQSGKSLSCFVIPILYHLFEVGETVCVGLPDMDMAGDKWREDILPVIQATKYREFIPTKGAGSRGGTFDSIQFLNGATLKFITGGGGDKSVAGFTSRILCITETDGMDKTSGTSRETDRVTQMEARTRAYGAHKRIYMECTVSIEDGRTWREYQAGTCSRIAIRCPRCHALVSPEREHFDGWKDAETIIDARNAGHFFCPACRVPWGEADRAIANRDSKLVHKGQQFGPDSETIEGKPIANDTFGFRWSAVNNLFVSAGDIAVDEWRAARAPDEELAEREMRQFVWCIPLEPPSQRIVDLDVMTVASRITSLPKGIVPADAGKITVGIDIGKYLCHWLAIAWSEGGKGHVCDYGRLEVASDSLGIENALIVALKEFADTVTTGWRVSGQENTGVAKVPDLAFIDTNYETPTVHKFLTQRGQPFFGAFGRGGDQTPHNYREPSQIAGVVVFVGEGYHVTHRAADGLRIVQVDSDHWKTWAHQRLKAPVGEMGSISLYNAPLQEHLAFARHLLAEEKYEEFVQKKGMLTKWRRVRQDNHWLDCLYLACAAGHLAGVRLILPEASVKIEPIKKPRTAKEEKQGMTRRDGRPWFRERGGRG